MSASSQDRARDILNSVLSPSQSQKPQSAPSVKPPLSSQSKASDMMRSVSLPKPAKGGGNLGLSHPNKEGDPFGFSTRKDTLLKSNLDSPVKSSPSSQTSSRNKAMDMLNSMNSFKTSRSMTNSPHKSNFGMTVKDSPNSGSNNFIDEKDKAQFSSGKEVSREANANPLMNPPPFVGFTSGTGRKLSVPKSSSFSKVPKDFMNDIQALMGSDFNAAFENPGKSNGFSTRKDTLLKSNLGSPVKSSPSSQTSSQNKGMDMLNSVNSFKTSRSRTNSPRKSNSGMAVKDSPNSGLNNFIERKDKVEFSLEKEVSREANANPLMNPSPFVGFTSGTGRKLSVPKSSSFSKVPKDFMNDIQALMGSDFNAAFENPNKNNIDFVAEEEAPLKGDTNTHSNPPPFVGFTSGKGGKLNIPHSTTPSKIPKELEDSFRALIGSNFDASFNSPNESNICFTTGKGAKLPSPSTIKDPPKNDFKVPSPSSFSGFTSGKGNKLSVPQPSTLSRIPKELENEFKALMEFSAINENDSSSGIPKNAFKCPTGENADRLARDLPSDDSQASSQSKAMDMIKSIRAPVMSPKPSIRKRPSSDTKVMAGIKRAQHKLESTPPAKVVKPEIQIESWSQQASQMDMFSTQEDISFLDQLSREEIPSQHQDPEPNESGDDYDELIKDIDLKSIDSDNDSESELNNSHKRDSSPLGNLFSSTTPTKMKYPAPVVLKSVPQSTQKTKTLGTSTRAFKRGCVFQTPLKGRAFVSPGKRSNDAVALNMSSSSSPSNTLNTPLERKGTERRRSLKVIPPPSLVHKYSLKDLEIDCGNKRSATLAECLQYKLLTQVIEMTSMNATIFRFRIVDFASELPTGITFSGDTIGPEDFMGLLKVSVDSPHLLTEAWVRNQWRWVVWKLASYERRFPSVFGGKYLTPKNVFQELCHRYNKECSKSRRSALKRIFEKDDISSRYMVLCVSSISIPQPAIPVDQQSQKGSQEPQEPQPGKTSEEGNSGAKCMWIELTDGWYPVKVQLDEYLSEALISGKIYEGQKLRICGAQRCGSDSGQDPLEAPDSVWLRVFVNGTRRAEWDAKLGFQKSRAFTVSLFSLKDMGGPIPSVEVCILRVYPPIYSELISGEGDEKRRIVRTEREEEREVRSFEERFERMYEQKIGEYSRATGGNSTENVLEMASRDVQNEMEKSRRDVTKILRFRVRDCPSYLAKVPYSEVDDGPRFKETILSVTAPQESSELDIKEGSWIKFYGVSEYKRRSVVSGVPDFPEKEISLHLSVSGSLPWRPLHAKKGAPPPPTFVPRQICRADTIGDQCKPGDEFDFVGVAVAFGDCILETGESADPTRDKGEPIELFLYATDTSENIIAILIRTKMGSQPKFSIGEVFSAENLLYSRFDSENDVHTCDASDTVVFSKKPLKPHLLKAKAEVDEWISKSPSAIETAIQRASLFTDGITLSQI